MPAVSDSLRPASVDTKRIERAFWLAVALVFIFGVVLRMQTFTDVWTGGHNAWGGAFYGNIARNFVRYGYWTTAFAPVVNSGMVDPSQFNFYYHHPPMTMWLTSVSFLAFGVHEWSARLVPLIFSLLTMALVFEFARSAYGNGVALCALAVMAVLPADAYYATHVDPNSSVSIFFTALAVEGYRRWLSSEQGRDYGIMFVAIVLGCMTGWFTYLIIPPIFAHFWLIHRAAKSRGMWTRVWLLPAVAVIIFGLFLLHREFVFSSGRQEVFDTLADRVVMRAAAPGFDPIEILAIYLRHIGSLYTLPFVALSAAWLMLFLRDFWNKRLEVADWCIAILLSYGLLYAIAFSGHLVWHDFFVRTYAPGVALATAVALFRAASALKLQHLRLAMIGVVVAGVCAFATMRTQTLYARDDSRSNGRTLQGFGEAVAMLTPPVEPVFLPFRDEILQYYVDRPITFDVDTRQKLEAATAAVSGPYLIIVPERSAERFPEFLAYLRDRYPERRDKGLFMFQGGQMRHER
jgi:4-amino-4-deoxy-L-arabinose transferase-like glycosyltransferase